MSKPTPIKLPALGIDMLSEETALKLAVRSGINVDFDRVGIFKRRSGTTRRLSLPDAHSIWHAAQKGWTLLMSGTDLLRLNPQNFQTDFMRRLPTSEAVSYCEYNGNLYFSSRDFLGYIPSYSAQAMVVGLRVPDAPLVEAVDNGPFTPGTYAVALTRVGPTGDESGSSKRATVELPDGGAIRLYGLPIEVGDRYNIYVTEPDGDQLRHAETIPAVFPNYVLGTRGKGALCTDYGLQPMVPGDIVRWHNGRLYTLRDGELNFSEAMGPHLYDPAHNRIPFVGYSSILEAVADGIYVGDSRGVWFLAGGDPTKFEAKLVSSNRAVARSSCMVAPEHFPEKKVTAESPVALWLSSVGYCVGMPGGTVIELQADRVKVPPGLCGRTAFLQRDGRKQVISTVNSLSTASHGTAVDSIIS